MAGVPLTDPEWVDAVQKYPSLNGHRAECLKTDGATSLYNCIAWSVGSETEWINTPQPRTAFEAFYATRGFVVCAAAEATADGYALVDGTMTHGSRFYLDVWSSKRGPNIRMTHPRYGLTPSVGYGNVVVSFKPHPTLTTAEAEPVTVSASGSGGEADTEAAAKITSLVEHSTEEFSILADSFDKNWDAWQKSWKNPKLIEFSSSSVFANGPEWDALVKMSTAILPQVVKKLQTTSNIFGCNLYNKLQTDPKKKVPTSDLNNYWVLNNQAKQIIKLYASQLTDFTHLATTLASHHSTAAASESSFSQTFTTGPAYDAIRDMGPVAVPFIMDLYAKNQEGWWHELLFEIVHGRKSGAGVFDKRALYKQWASWYQGWAAPGAGETPAA